MKEMRTSASLEMTTQDMAKDSYVVKIIDFLIMRQNLGTNESCNRV